MLDINKSRLYGTILKVNAKRIVKEGIAYKLKWKADEIKNLKINKSMSRQEKREKKNSQGGIKMIDAKFIIER